MQSETQLTKEGIRSKILTCLRKQKEEERQQKSAEIKKKLFLLDVFRMARTAMFYLSYDGEVDTREMIEEARLFGKRIVVPVCIRESCSIRPALLRPEGVLTKGPYGIREPAAKSFVDIKELDLVIVPGVAFDKDGNRLGRGKGYYDRFLKTLKEDTYTIGLAFDFQILPSLPVTETDIGVDEVIFA